MKIQLKKKIKNFDFLFLGGLLVLIAIGLLSVYSTTYNKSLTLFYKQTMWIGVGILFGIFFYFFSLRMLQSFSGFLYFISLFTLVLVLLLGAKIHGTKRWIDLGVFKFQPSEFAKFTTMVFLANILSNKNFKIKEMRHLILPLVIVGLPFLLIVVEPDFGTALVFLALGGWFLIYKETPWIYIFLLLSPVLALICGIHWVVLIVYIVVVGCIFFFSRLSMKEFIFAMILNIIPGLLHPLIWNQLKSYQRARITTFLFPSKDLHGKGWQIFQSKIAIGSGGIVGKGMFKGTQKGFDFLPEVHTDFIFSAIGEEMGFFGGIVVLGMFFLLIWRCLVVAKIARSPFCGLLGVGVGGYLFFHVVGNIGMTIGVLPVVGLPLTFISYGGSNIIVSFIMAGLFLNVAKHRFQY